VAQRKGLGDKSAVKRKEQVFGLHGNYGNKPTRRLFAALRLWRAFNCIGDFTCVREPGAAGDCFLLGNNAAPSGSPRIGLLRD
jgi:hypothetical protein